jgi:hypothetical protein
MLKQTVFVVYEQKGSAIDFIGARLTLEAAVLLCKEGSNRARVKLIATKGDDRFDITQQQEKQRWP